MIEENVLESFLAKFGVCDFVRLIST